MKKGPEKLGVKENSKEEEQRGVPRNSNICTNMTLAQMRLIGLKRIIFSVVYNTRCG